jgi:hypothetical protein
MRSESGAGAWRRSLIAGAAVLTVAAPPPLGGGDLSCAPSGVRDVIPESRDVRVLDAGPAAEDTRGYEYIARRPLALVALAEARGIAPDVARAAVDRLADALDACVTERGRRSAHVEGAARVVAPIEQSGSVGAPSVRLDPGEGVAENAVVCLVAPVRLLTFPPVDAGVRGIAIEALWGRIIPTR